MSIGSNASKRGASRRSFLGAAATAASAFTIVPRHVLGGQGQTPPSERLNIAGVGMGGQGTGVVQRFGKHNIAALCDVDHKKAARAYELFPKAQRHEDFRRMLEDQPEIEAVVVATPDHLHAPVSLAAMQAGKHVYCEKPLTHNIHEASLMAKSAREHGVATQMGNSGQASEGTRRTAEYIADGAIGPVREVHIWTDRPLGWWPQGIDRPKETPPTPSTLNWDLWLGPAPERPYNPAYLPFVWRGWKDFGTGALGDMGCHAFDPVFRALKLEQPTSVVASSTELKRETYPLASIVRYEFPARGDWPEVKLTWYDGGLKPDWPQDLTAEQRLRSGGTMYIGDDGVLIAGRDGDPLLLPDARRAQYKPPEKTLPRSIGHFAEWTEACKGGPPAGAEFQFASQVTQAVLLGNIALSSDSSHRSGRRPESMPKLYWDAEALQITNFPEANKLLRREYRKGWQL